MEVTASAAGERYLEVAKVAKSFGATPVLRDVSLDIRKGEFVTLLGPSGSGKSTLLQIIAGFETLDTGAVRLEGQDLSGHPAHKRDFGMVFQNYALFSNMDVFGNVAYPLKRRSRPRDEIDRRVSEVLALVHLDGMENRRVDQLSGGQRQRVALARAIVFRPRVLLMDEPLSALDKKMREQMQGEIRQIHDQTGMTTIFVTHDQREALTLSDRIAVLEGGRVAQFDTPLGLYTTPSNRFVADFIGEATFLPLQRRDDGGLLYAGTPILSRTAPLPAGPLWMVARPEKIQLVTTEPLVDSNVFSATLVSAVFQGESTLLTTRLDDGQDLFVRVPGAAAPGGPGSRTRLALHRDHTIVVGER